MALLPATGRTLHFDASDNTHLFTTFVVGGPHTGTVSDGTTVGAWTSADGVDQVWRPDGASPLPVWRSVTPLMRRPCLDFTGGQRMFLGKLDGNQWALSDIITGPASTLLLTFYAETITSINNNYLAHPLIGDGTGFWGALVSLAAGVPKVLAFNYDGTQDYVRIDCAAGAAHLVMLRHQTPTLYGALDGGAESSTASGDTSLLVNRPQLGVTAGSSIPYDGRIGEIAVYNRALTPAEVLEATTYFMDKWVTGGPAVLSGELDRRTLTSATGTLNATWTGTAAGNWTAGVVALKKT